MHKIDIPVKLLHKDAQVPTKSHFADAGWDLYSIEDVNIGPTVVKIRTGIAMSIPKGYVGLIWDRSGISSHGLKVHGGVIDSGYTGEIIVCISYPAQNQHKYTSHEDKPEKFELDDEAVRWQLSLKKGSRVAQILIQEIPIHCTMSPVDELPSTDRGDGGFGSTGD